MQISEITEQISFQSGSLKLSGILSYPADREPERSILLCSPHPHFAGDMENNVIQYLANYFARDSVTLRFDYRGVGKSNIDLPPGFSVFDYWQQVEESMDYHDALEDVHSAAGELLDVAREIPFIVVGYSFGMATGFQYGINTESASMLIGIASPIGKVNFGFLSHCTKPCLVITGKEDFLYTPEQLDKFRQSCRASITIDLWEKSDHFFREEEEKLAIAIDGFIHENHMEPERNK
jgi:alpha/beta superfamily hydrolase